MIDKSGSAGYFTQPFVTVQPLGIWQCATGGVADTFGPWAHLAAPLGTIQGRWLTIICSPNDQPTATYLRLQAGQGVPGLETLLYPNVFNGNNDYFQGRYGLTDGTRLVPIEFSFPCLISAGVDLSFRLANDLNAAQTVVLDVLIWA